MESAFVDDFIVYWPPILRLSPVFCPVNPRTVKSPADKDSAKTGLLEAPGGRLIDPSVAPVRALPRDERELFIAASNGHVLAFDNVSGLPLSDQSRHRRSPRELRNWSIGRGH